MDLPIVPADYLQKTNKEYKKFNQKKINQKKSASSMIRLMEVLNIYREEQLMAKFYMMKNLILLEI